MNCEQAQLVMAMHALGDATLPDAQQEELESHLRVCPACREEYRQNERIIRVLRGMPGMLLLRAVRGLPVDPTDPSMDFDTGTATNTPAAADRRSWLRSRNLGRYALRAGAIAAAVLLCGWLGLSSRQMHGSADPASQSGAGICQSDRGDSIPMGIASRLGDSGQVVESRRILAGDSLDAESRLRVRIWDRHELVAEPGTRLAFALTEDRGCRLALQRGQVTVSVNRAAGEGVFRVTTPHTELAVTGTLFTVTSTSDHTHLNVAEGTVRMSVPAGARRSPPSVQMVAAGQSFTSNGVKIIRDPIDLSMLLAASETTNDPVIALQRSPWYRQRFAPLLALRDYLRNRGEPVDELTLLAISGDLWCLQYPKDSSTCRSRHLHRKAGLERAARFHGYAIQWVAPTDADEMKDLLRQARTAGDLVLAFNDAPHGVRTLSAADYEDFNPNQPGEYRFLGEDRISRPALARIVPAEGSAKSQASLAREALADVQRLLTSVTDAENLIGEEALRTWAARIAATGQGVGLDDPLFQALTAASLLGNACREPYARLGLAPENLLRWHDACTELEARCRLAINRRITTETLCQRQQESQEHERLRDLLRAVHAIGRDSPGR